MRRTAGVQAVGDTRGASEKESEQQVSRSGLKRYNLVLPETLYSELEQVAASRNTSVVEMLRRFIKLGLLAVQIEETPGAALLIREGETEREIILL